MITAAKYRRISDDKESEEHGITRQNEDIDKLAADRGLTIVSDRSDNDVGASTRSKKARPDYDAMVADAKAGLFTHILAYSSSRLTRRPRENEDLIELAERYGITFLYVRSPSFNLNTADGRMVARILAASDAAESERRGERVSRAKSANAAAGKFTGGRRMFGFTPSGQPGVVDIDETEAAVMREAASRLLSGVSLRSVAAELQASGIPTVSGAPWTSQTLRDVLTKKAAQKILGEHVWLGVRALGSNRTQAPGSEPSHLLSGLASCQCGEGMQYNKTRNRYRCKDFRGGCASIDADALEHYVVGAVFAFLTRPDVADLLVPDNTVDADALRLAAAADRAMLVAAAEAQLAASVFVSPSAELMDGSDVDVSWRCLSHASRRSIIAELLEIVVRPGGGRGFDEAAVMLTWRAEE